jgi:hypothetical protein
LITATYRYFVDWDGDNSFAIPGEDISAFVFEATWEYGRDYASQLSGRSKAGSCRITLDNSDSRFSPFNVSSAIYGKMLPGRRVRITMRIGGGAEVIMWQGFLESISPTVGAVVGISTAELLAYGALAHRSLQGQVSVPMHTDITTGAAIAEVLDQAQFPVTDRMIDPGLGAMARWWDKGTAIQALRDLEETEAGFLRETKDGKIAFEDRAHRLSAPHTVSQATYGGGSLVLWNPQQGDSAKGIFNHIEAAVRCFDVSEEMVLWTLSGNPPAIAPGATLSIKGQFPTPTSSGGYIAVSEWTATDYQANNQADGGGSDLTEDVDAVATKSASEILLEFTNNGTETAYLTLCRCHGIAVVESDPVKVWAEDDESKERFGYLPYTNAGKFLTNIQEAQDRCDHFLAIYKDPVPILSFDLKANYNAVHLAEAQVRDVSDRITIRAGAPYGLFIDEHFFVEWIRHSVGRDKLHTVTLLCSSVVSHHWPANGTPYEPKTIPPPDTGGEPHVPDDPWTNSIVNGMNVLVGCMMRKWNADISEAEFRAQCFLNGEKPDTADLRTPAEGGDLVHDGIASLVVSGLGASYAGRNYLISGLASGRWYYAWRFKNDSGWSVWSDGNDVPQYVRDYAETGDESSADTGPPAKWTGSIAPGPQPNTVVVSVSRPEENGNVILFIFFQVKDASDEGWNPFDDELGSDDGECHVAYDGSEVAHRYNPATGALEKDDAGWGDAVAGDLMLFDVRGKGGDADVATHWSSPGKIESDKTQSHLDAVDSGNILLISRHGVSESIYSDFYMAATRKSSGGGLWDLKHCLWGTIPEPGSNRIAGLFGFRCIAPPGPDGWYRDVRVKIVHGPWSWNRHGYFGSLPTHGWFVIDSWKIDGGDRKTRTFVSDPIPIPGDVPIEHIQARVVFGNGYSFSDDDYRTDFSPASTQPGGPVPVKDGPKLDIDARLGCVFSILLTRDCTLSAPTGATHGQPILVIVTQDDVGGHQLSLGPGFNLGDVEYEIALGAGKRSYLGFIYNGDEKVFDLVPPLKGY